MSGLLTTIRKRRWHYAYLFISPVLVLFGLFRIYPSVQTLVFSFFKINVVTREYKPVGLENFRLLLQDATFGKALENTFLYAVAIVTIATFLGIVLAALFTSRLRGGGVFRGIYFAPYVTSTVAAAPPSSCSTSCRIIGAGSRISGPLSAFASQIL